VYFSILCILFLFCVYCVSAFFVLFCVLFLLLYTAVSLLFLYKSTNRYHRVETQFAVNNKYQYQNKYTVYL